MTIPAEPSRMAQTDVEAFFADFILPEVARVEEELNRFLADHGLGEYHVKYDTSPLLPKRTDAPPP